MEVKEAVEAVEEAVEARAAPRRVDMSRDTRRKEDR
jgi:hypothetical protein